ncbi:MAG UNVERIFIED_CONTAM: SMP-30/gluconolactonase/LRE family protein [Planctomycetaceae bacterium]
MFRRVYSSVGSFTNLRGANEYPSLIRKTEPKPIRIYMADTSGDLDNRFGHWPLANQLMHAALQYMGYDVRLDWAEGYAHNADFGGARFPDAMRWLWRREQHRPVYDTRGDLGGDLTLLKLIVPNAGWELAVDKLGFADALCADQQGNLYFCDMKSPAVFRLDAKDGSQKEVVKESVSGLEFGPDGRLYACQGSKKRIIAIQPTDGSLEVIAEQAAPNDLAVSSDGFLYYTDTAAGHVVRINITTRERSVAAEGLAKPNGIALSNDGGTLGVSEYGGSVTWMFRVNSGGSLDSGMPSMPLRQLIDPSGEFRFNDGPPEFQLHAVMEWPSMPTAAGTSPVPPVCRSSTQPAGPAESCTHQIPSSPPPRAFLPAVTFKLCSLLREDRSSAVR